MFVCFVAVKSLSCSCCFSVSLSPPKPAPEPQNERGRWRRSIEKGIVDQVLDKLPCIEHTRALFLPYCVVMVHVHSSYRANGAFAALSVALGMRAHLLRSHNYR